VVVARIGGDVAVAELLGTALRATALRTTLAAALAILPTATTAGTTATATTTAATTGATTTFTATAQEQHLVRHDLGGVLLHALFVLVAARLQSTLDVDLAALREVLVAGLGLLAPHGHTMPLGLFDAIVGLVHVDARG